MEGSHAGEDGGSDKQLCKEKREQPGRDVIHSGSSRLERGLRHRWRASVEGEYVGMEVVVLTACFGCGPLSNHVTETAKEI